MSRGIRARRSIKQRAAARARCVVSSPRTIRARTPSERWCRGLKSEAVFSQGISGRGK